MINMNSLLVIGAGTSSRGIARMLSAVGNTTLRGRYPCRYSTQNKEDDSVVEKARSTAEEFLRQAKEKSESITQTVKETVEDAKEAVKGDAQEGKEKFREKVEKGNYDKNGRD